MNPRKVKPALLKHLLSIEANHFLVPDTPFDSPLLRLLFSADRGQLSQSITEQNCSPGEIVVQEGEAGDTLFLIRSGRVAIVKGDLDSPTILDYRGAGEVIGEMAILENRARSASIIALEDLSLLRLDRLSFERLLQDTPSISLDIMELLSSRLRRSDEARNTSVLSEKRLHQQVSTLQSEKRHLEELQRLRQETTELVIHDLRNPLCAIAIAIKMLTLTMPEEILRANQELLKITQANCERMQQLVDSLLEISCMEAGKAHFTMGLLDMALLIQDVVNRNRILTRKGVTIQTLIAAKLPPVIADRDKIERVLVNLVDNAIKYTPEKGSITFAAERDGDFIKVSVSDTGPGIPEEERNRIFERFARVSGDEVDHRGFGLGLTYCRLAVEHHGGHIYVEEGEGGLGSRFVFTLPVSINERKKDDDPDQGFLNPK